MPSKHTISAGAVLSFPSGATAHAQTKFEQEISIDPVTGRPINAVTSLVQQLIVLDENMNQHIVSVTPLEAGNGVEVRYNAKPEWLGRVR